MQKNLVVYQAKNGAIELLTDVNKETIWITQKQLSQIFDVNVRTVNEHIQNIFKTAELSENSVIRDFRITAEDGKSYLTKHYNLDVIISVGYRVNSKKATQFRIWATKTLKQHITQGYTINPSLIQKNYNQFLKAVEDVKLLAKGNALLKSDDVLELVKTFAGTWFSLESYDESNLPEQGFTKKDLKIQASDLYLAVAEFKAELIRKKEATDLFAQEKKNKNLEGIFGNVFQTAFGEEVYSTLEEKAAHLLYFIIKNHPFNDGNKRTGAFTFVWFLQKSGLKSLAKITPETLTALALLIAESNPKDKTKMTGLVLLLLNNKK